MSYKKRTLEAPIQSELTDRSVGWLARILSSVASVVNTPLTAICTHPFDDVFRHLFTSILLNEMACSLDRKRRRYVLEDRTKMRLGGRGDRVFSSSVASCCTSCRAAWQRIRLFGLLVNRHRRDKLALCRTLLSGAAGHTVTNQPLPRNYQSLYETVTVNLYSSARPVARVP